MTVIKKVFADEDGGTITEYTNAYIAKKSDSQKAMQWLSLMKAHLVHFTKEDTGSIGVRAYILDYKGVGNRRTLQGIVYCKVDIGSVGDYFIDVWPREVLLKIGAPREQTKPIRTSYRGDRVYKVV